MNQPKFRIGDKVYFPDREDHKGSVYTILGILLYEKSVSYFLEEMQDGPVHESHLELFQEPQKKKILFYKALDSNRLLPYANGETAPYGLDLYAEIEIDQ